MDNKLDNCVWFGTGIFCDSILDISLISDLKNKAISLKDNYKTSKTFWRCNTFNTLDQYDWQKEKDSCVLKIIDTCSDKIKKISSIYGVDTTKYLPRCQGFWFNISDPGSFQEYHQHDCSHFSLSYYLETPNNCGNIVFKSFESIFDMYPLPIEENNLNELSYKTCSYRPHPGMLLVFRSNLLHMVEQNQSQENRISISMNFVLEKI